MAVGEISVVMNFIFLSLKQMSHVFNWDIVGTALTAAVGPFQGLYQCNIF